MDETESLARFGIGKKFAYGLFIQSILVIIAAILSLNILQWYFFNGGTTVEYICGILLFLTCISLLIYSFYEYNKNTEYFFIIPIILLVINALLWVIGDLNYISDLYSAIGVILGILEVIFAIYFLYAFNKNYTSAKYIIILIVIFVIIVEIISCLCFDWPWYGAVPYIVISVSIALTYFERVQRGKYPKIK